MLNPHAQNSKPRALVFAKIFALCALSLLLLSACGGGGGSSTPPAPTTQTCSDGTVIPVGATCPPQILFPRISPDVTVPPDSADFATDVIAFSASAEYRPQYFITNRITNDVIDTRTDVHLRRINAAAAYARGATGEGEIIAVVDSGIRETHREFAGSAPGESKVTKVTQSGYFPTDANKAHGTYVAALAVGNRDGDSGGMHGVAFEARLHFTEIRLGTSDGIYRPLVLADYGSDNDMGDAAFFSEFIANARAANAAIINSSFGRNGAISLYEPQELRRRFARTAAALAQAGTVDADKTIIVWAAGNAGGQRLLGGQAPNFDSPEVWSGLGAYFPELHSHILAVVALDQDGGIAGYSNHCGIAKGFCLAAPGSNIFSASSFDDNRYGWVNNVELVSGTSFAAPIVSGSLALLRQYFRTQLGNTELVTRLLATANRDGIYANSDIYGHGLVDLDKATAPVGGLMTGLPGDPNSQPFTGSNIALSGAAFGSSLQNTLANVEVAAFDSLGAPFFQSAAHWVTQPAQQRGSGFGSDRKQRSLSLAALPYQTNGAKLSLGFNDDTLNDARFSFADGGWFSYREHGGRALGLPEHLPEQSFANQPNPLNDLRRAVSGNHSEHRYTEHAQHFSSPLAFAAPYLSLVRDGPAIGWAQARAGRGRFGFALMHGAPQFDGEQNPGGKRGFGALLALSLDNGLSLQAGAVHEGDSLLGARLQGALGQAQGATTFIGANGSWTFADDWRVLTSAYLGRTDPQVDASGLLHDASTLLSSAFSIGALRASMWRRGDWFGLRLSQPLRVESGTMQLRLPSGRTKYGEVVHTNHQVRLAPAGRSLQAEATYQIPFAGGVLKTNMGAEHHPQHNRTSDLRPFMRLSFERRF